MEQKEKLKLSVIIPVFNCERHIARCLDSILSQEQRGIEIICVDDHSEDDSLSIIKMFAAEHNNIRVYPNREHLWQGQCRNIGLKEAQGEYIWFVDGDDIVTSGALHSILEELQKTEADIFLFNAWRSEETSGSRREWPYNLHVGETLAGAELYKQMVNSGGSDNVVWRRIFKRKFLLEKSCFFSGGDPHEDLMFGIRTMILASKVETVDAYIYEYVVRATSSSKNAEYASKRIWSLSYVLSELFDLYHSTNEETLKPYFYSEIQYISFLLADRIRNIEQIDRCGVKDEDPRMLYFGMSASALYGGSFPLLLFPENMRRIREAKKLMIYGTGDEGKGLLRLLSDRNIKVSSFVTSDEPGAKEVSGTPVKCIRKLKAAGSDLIFLAAKSTFSKEEMKKRAKEQGFLDVQIMAV